MKKNLLYSITLLLLTAHNLAAQVDPALEPVAKWFAAWELMSKQVYGLDTLRPVEFVFFDNTNIYSTSAVSVANGEPVEGPALFGKKMNWKKDTLGATIILPDKQVVAVGLMSFASPLQGEGKNAFFVMPLPGFWKAAGVNSKEIGLENLVTGVFLHEFSHTQQMQNFGSKITAYEKDPLFASMNFSDDIIQEYFGKDSVYTARFHKENELFYTAAAATGEAGSKALIKKAMQMLKSRQKNYFTGEKELLKQVDDFFLTMEGMGQYTMYAWLVHPAGANLDTKTAIAAVRRGKKWWSQEEGLALFLVLERYAKPRKWAKLMFGTETVPVVELINSELK